MLFLSSRQSPDAGEQASAAQRQSYTSNISAAKASLLQQGLLIGGLPLQLLRLGFQLAHMVGVLGPQDADLLLLLLLCSTPLGTRLPPSLHQPAACMPLTDDG